MKSSVKISQCEIMHLELVGNVDAELSKCTNQSLFFVGVTKH